MIEKLNQFIREYRNEGKKGDAKHLDWAITNEPEAEIAVKEPSLFEGIVMIVLGLVAVYALVMGHPEAKYGVSAFLGFVFVVIVEMRQAKRMRDQLEYVREYKHSCPECGTVHVPEREE